MSPHNKRWLTAISLLLVSILFLKTPSLSQECQQPVCLSESHGDFSQLTIGDIDFENFGSSRWLFTINVNTFGSLQMEVKLSVSIDVALASDNFPNAVSFRTMPITAPKSFTNIDIGKNGSIKIEPGSFHYSSEATDKIKNVALSTGKLPTGTYTFNLTAEDVLNASNFSTTQFVVIIQNPSRVELTSPMDNSSVPSAFPLFQWQYDGDQVELSVYEKLPQHQSNEEALTGTPYLVVRSGDPLLPAGVRTLQYPTAGARSLEEGKTYVWTVKAIASGSGGSDAGVNSQIWQFTISTSGGSAGSNNSVEHFVTTEQLSEQLQEIPGIDAKSLKKLLSDYQMTGDIYINGQKISAAELKQLLEELLANPDRIVEMKVINQ